MSSPTVGSWSDVVELLRQRPAGTLLKLPRGWLEHPRVFEMTPTRGLPLGQRNDYWKRLDDQEGLQVTSFENYHVAQLQPLRPAEDERAERAGEPIHCASAMGVLIGALIGQDVPALVVGAALGAAVESASLASSPGSRALIVRLDRR